MNIPLTSPSGAVYWTSKYSRPAGPGTAPSPGEWVAGESIIRYETDDGRPVELAPPEEVNALPADERGWWQPNVAPHEGSYRLRGAGVRLRYEDTPAAWGTMTEAAWLTRTTLYGMLQVLRGRRPEAITDRRLRLPDVACIRRAWRLRPDDMARRLVEVCERAADGKAGRDEVSAALVGAIPSLEASPIGTLLHASSLRQFLNPSANEAECPYIANHVSLAVGGAAGDGAWATERRAQLALLHDISGNPFRPMTVDPSWLTRTAVALARQMYASREFAAMPILADALQDAGCESPDILDHSRGPGPHVRGCWVVDLVLGRG